MVDNFIEVFEISADQTLTIRHQVLWPDESIDFCRVEGDDQARHFGVRHHGNLVSVASLYFDGDAYAVKVGDSDSPLKTARLRKFATLPDYQGKGIGTVLLQHMLQQLQEIGINCLWFDARESAVDFYARFGFKTEGERFFKSDVPYFKMNKLLGIA